MLERLGAWQGRDQRIVLLLLCMALFAVWQAMPLSDIDETRYAVSSRHMLQTGNFLMPEFNGQPRYAKPVLFYWVQSTCMRIFGGSITTSEFGARLPSAIFGILLVLLVHAFLLRWLTIGAGDDEEARARARGAAFVGGLAVATVPLVAFWSLMGGTDLLLSFFITGAILSLAHADLARRHAKPERAQRMGRGMYIVAAICAGLAFLTKGPIGLAIPGLVWLAYHLRQGTLAFEARRVSWMWVPTVLAFVLVAAPWYVVSYLVLGPAFLTTFFGTENAGRLFGFDGKYLGQVLAFLPGALLLTFPFCAFLLREAVQPFTGVRALRDDTILPALRRFAWAWLIAPLALFMFAKTNYPNYYQSLAGALGVLMALHVLGRTMAGARDRTDDEAHAVNVEAWAFGLVGGVLVGLFAVMLALGKAPFRPRPWNLPFTHPAREIVLALVLLVGGALLVGGLHWLKQRNTDLQLRWVLLGWTAMVAVIVFGVMPLALRQWYRPGADVGDYLRKVPAETRVAVYARHFPEEMVFYGKRQVDFFDANMPGELTRLVQLTAGGPVVVVTDAAGFGALQMRTHASKVQDFPYFIVAQLGATTDGEGLANSNPQPEAPDAAALRRGTVGGPETGGPPAMPPMLEAPDTRRPTYIGPDAPVSTPQPPQSQPTAPSMPTGPPGR
jgi:4-amino-4-deoxy-L-arabinose transferase-like glycosyltransferase